MHIQGKIGGFVEIAFKNMRYVMFKTCKIVYNRP